MDQAGDNPSSSLSALNLSALNDLSQPFVDDLEVAIRSFASMMKLCRSADSRSGSSAAVREVPPLRFDLNSEALGEVLVDSVKGVKAVQRMLGHKVAAMTIDTYSGLLEEDLDAVAQALNAAGGPVCGDPRCASCGWATWLRYRSPGS